MSIFKQTFPGYIKAELDKRGQFDYTQDYISPFIRVTSLVRGSIFGSPELFGFTIGIPDNISSNVIDSIINTSKTGCVVGLTYFNENAEEVKIKDVPVNIPSPGVTDVEINHLYRGGVVFDSTIKFKFYTIYQYNFLYQVLFRPGTLVMVEFGHRFANKNEEIPRLTKSLIEKRMDDYGNGMKFISSANYNYVVGITTNYSITPNQNGEYEATIQLTNSSDLAWQFSVEKSRIAFGSDDISTSFNQLFGQPSSFPLSSGGSKQYLNDKVYRRIKLLFDFSLNALRDTGTSEHLDVMSGIWKPVTPDPLQNNEMAGGASPFGGFESYYISLYTFIKNVYNQYMLDEILGNINPETIPNWKFGMQIPRDLYKNSLMIDVDYPNSNIPYYSNLRTTNFQDCIFNNISIYSDTFFKEKRGSRYLTELSVMDITKNVASIQRQVNSGENRSATAGENLAGVGFDSNEVMDAMMTEFFFSYQDNTEDINSLNVKYKYEPVNQNIIPEFSSIKGIFISYDAIKNSFLTAKTIGAAFNNLLGKINSSTNNILNLKLRKISNDDGTSSLIIYDDNVKLNGDREIPYEFDLLFRNSSQPSPIINISMDFSLSERSAATIMAQSKKNGSIYVGGDIRETKLVEISMNENIQSLFVAPQRDKMADQPEPSPKNPVSSEVYTMLFNNKIGGMVEFLPEEMTSDILNTSSKDSDHKTILSTLPCSPKVNIRFLGISNFRFGELFKIKGLLPSDYDDGLFFVLGHKQVINSDGWVTDLEAQFIGIQEVVDTTPNQELPFYKRNTTTNLFGEQPSTVRIPMANAPINQTAFNSALGARESGNNYAAVNSLGYVGKYQFGAAALEDVGYVKPGVYKKFGNAGLNDPNNWTIPGGKQAFLNNPTLQESAMTKFTDRNYSQLVRLKVIGSDSTKEDISGYLAVSHLLGPGGALQFKRGDNGRDAFGTRASEYFELGKKSQGS